MSRPLLSLSLYVFLFFLDEDYFSFLLIALFATSALNGWSGDFAGLVLSLFLLMGSLSIGEYLYIVS
jgi:hypothetical protein